MNAFFKSQSNYCSVYLDVFEYWRFFLYGSCGSALVSLEVCSPTQILLIFQTSTIRHSVFSFSFNLYFFILEFRNLFFIWSSYSFLCSPLLSPLSYPSFCSFLLFFLFLALFSPSVYSLYFLIFLIVFFYLFFSIFLLLYSVCFSLLFYHGDV